MPNWTHNVMTFKGNPERISELKNHILTFDENGDPQFDFNRVIPMPEELIGTQAPSFFHRKEPNDLVEKIISGMYDTTPPQDMTDEELLTKLSDHFKTIEEVKEGRFKSQQLVKKYGFDNWYDWCIEHWGVKWNSTGVSIDEDEPNVFSIGFDTPWSEPQLIFGKLHELYQDLEYNITFTHEGGFGGEDISWNPNELTFTVQKLEEKVVYEDEEGNPIECGYDEETDEYLDNDGNVVEDYDWVYLPVGEKNIIQFNNPLGIQQFQS